MARKTHVVLVDDIDGSDASETIAFTIDGVSYEIDVNEKNAEALRADFGRWASAGRRTGGRRTTGRAGAVAPRRTSSSDNDALRSWARENGYDVKDRGRVPAEVRQAYETANGR